MMRSALPLLTIVCLLTDVSEASEVAARAPDVFESYLSTDIPPADGFDLPVEAGAQRVEVRAVARGKVVFSGDLGTPWGHVVVVEHLFYENHEQRRIRSLYARLQERIVKAGEFVARRQRIGRLDGTRAQLLFELRWETALPPVPGEGSTRAIATDEFIRAHQRLSIPQDESTLALIDAVSRKMRLYERGRLRGTYEVAFGQAAGQKERQGDLKTPRGMYFVVDRHRGEISGEYGAYYGGFWIKLNYPNAYDAARGRATGLISAREERDIVERWRQRALTPQRTALGGGIGLHGWISEWPNDSARRLSWGCVVMHLRDAPTIFEALPVGTMVVLL